jgi:hypothetical protein
MENRQPDFDGDLTIGELKTQEKIGTIKMWRHPNNDPKQQPSLAGYVIIDGQFYRVHLWDTTLSPK